MNDGNKDDVVTPMVAPNDPSKFDEKARTVDTEAPVSTDREGDRVRYPDLGGRID